MLEMRREILTSQFGQILDKEGISEYEQDLKVFVS